MSESKSAAWYGVPRPSLLLYIVRDPRGAMLANYNRMGSFLPPNFYQLASRRKRRQAKQRAGHLAARRQGADGSSHLSTVQVHDLQQRVTAIQVA